MDNLIIQESKKIVNQIDFSWLENKKVLVTGASGLIGLYFVSTLKLLKEKYNIKIYAWTKNEVDINFTDIFEGCELIKGDITNQEMFDFLPEFDCIIHSAGYGQPGKFLQDKLKTIELNTNSTISLLKKLNKKGKFLFISTSEIYSGLESENISEDLVGTSNTNHPRSCYIEGKRVGESICYIHSELGYDVKIARLSLAYGPGTKKGDHRVLNSLIEKGINNPTIQLLDSGDAIRTYCYITDTIEMFWNILLHGNEILYNVGGVSKVSILELANEISKKLNTTVIVPKSQNSLIGNPKIVNMSIEKYLKEFQKDVFVKLEDGLDTTIKWQKTLYNG